LIFWLFFAGFIFFNDKIDKYTIQKINFKTAIKELHLSFYPFYIWFRYG